MTALIRTLGIAANAMRSRRLAARAASEARRQPADDTPTAQALGAVADYTAVRLLVGSALRNTAASVAINGAGDREGPGADRGASPG